MLWHLCDDDVDDDEEIFIEYYMSFEWRFYDNFTYVISFFVFHPLTHSAYCCLLSKENRNLKKRKKISSDDQEFFSL